MSNPFLNVDQVNAIIRVRRGLEIDRTQTIYESGELVYSTDNKRVFVGDSDDFGASGTLGGIPVGNKIWITNNFEKLSGIVQNDLVYRTDIGTGFYLLTGSNYLRFDNYIFVNASNNTGAGTPYVLSAATPTTLGGVIVKDGLIVNNGFIRVNVDDSSIKIDPLTNKLFVPATTNNQNVTISKATENTLGVVKVPLDGGIRVSDGDLSVNIDNITVKLSSTGTSSKLYVDPTQLNIPLANSSTLGRVRIGEGLSATNTGILNLRRASETNLGGIRVGGGLLIDSNDGMLSVDGTLYDSIPIGTIITFGISSVPTGFLECSGGIVTVQDYSLLADVISATYNTGLSTQYYNSSDELTSFRVPYLSGDFISCIKATKTINNVEVPFGDFIEKPLSPNTGDVLTVDEYGNWLGSSIFNVVPRATNLVPGLITVGSGLSADTFGKVDVKLATTTDIGGVILGDGLSANPTTGKIDVVTSFSQIATPSTLGGVKVGTGLSATNDGTLNLKEASSTELGGIVLGNGLFKDPNTGKVNVAAAGGGTVPSGAIMMFPSATIPSGWVACDGQELDNTVIANLPLYGVIGYTYGGTGNKFNVPDLRGEFVRGWDDGRGVDTGRTLGSSQKGTLYGFDLNNDAVYNLSTPLFQNNARNAIGVDNYVITSYANVSLQGIGNSVELSLPGNESGSGTGGYSGVMRPRNIALIYCIKL